MPRIPIVYHIPVCPFSQRLEIMLALKGVRDAVSFQVVDITRPRDPELLEKTRGTTALPVLEMPGGEILKESLVILRYLDETVGDTPLRRADPLYDLVLLTDWNWPDATPGRGSAIFLHRWRRPGFPTEGCIAFRPDHLRQIAALAAPGTRLIVP